MENAYTEPLGAGNYSLRLDSMEVVDGKYGESYLFKGNIKEDEGNTFVLWITKPLKFTFGTDLGKLYRSANVNIPKGKLSDKIVEKDFLKKYVPIKLTYNDGDHARCRLRGI